MPVRGEVRALTEQVAARTMARLATLPDEEYAWEAVPGGWHAGPRDDGGFRYDLEHPAPDPAPFTSLAWRLFHLMGCYSADRNAALLGVATGRDPLLHEITSATTAAGAVNLLGACQQLWLTFLDEVSDDALASPLGDKAGDYGHATGLDFVLHQIDEHIHHAAEIALLRDFFRATRPQRVPIGRGSRSEGER